MKEQVSCGTFANAGPETLKADSRLIWATLGQPRGKQDCVDGARTGPADGVEFEIVLLKQPVKHAPGEGAKDTPALQRERELPLVTARLSSLEHGSIEGQEIRSSPAALTSGIPLGQTDELQKGTPDQAGLRIRTGTLG